MIVSLSSVAGAPGVSSWSLLLAAAWPSTPPVERVVLEADADGGVFAARYGLGVEPGVAALVAAVRRHDLRARWLTLDEVGRRLAEWVWVIPGPESAEATVPVWASAVDEVAAVAARDHRVWLVDCGRLSRGSLAGAFVARSELALVVCGPTPEELVAVPARLTSLLRSGATAVAVLIVGKPAYQRAELRDFFGTGLVWQVRAARDVAALANTALTSRRARRTWVWREAVDVAGAIADRVIVDVAAPAAPVAGLSEAVAGDE